MRHITFLILCYGVYIVRSSGVPLMTIVSATPSSVSYALRFYFSLYLNHLNICFQNNTSVLIFICIYMICTGMCF